MKSIPALILIDLQEGFKNEEHWGGNRNNLFAEENAAKLLAYWRANEMPLFHVKHDSTEENSPLNPKNEGNKILEIVAPKDGEVVIGKNVNSAFIGTDLKERLDAVNIETLVIVGLTTNHCISTTTRMAGNLGYETFLIADATATFDRKGIDGMDYSSELMHETALASLNEEFATVLNTSQILEKLEVSTPS
ncbi:cysteine hydrolase family protein [Sediminitomix flava]|uniref:Nicotinamidase-related amidase n=1 Tax=Sediminitomix flava TaxID=379075 RepID=A0A315ZJS1_SEDFL|nr:cysteine hydrolase family protein [Sediminitomix flava]PWJ45078.1 nicotinamidase-related amidase [Sediminitomix flava]